MTLSGTKANCSALFSPQKDNCIDSTRVRRWGQARNNLDTQEKIKIRDLVTVEHRTLAARAAIEGLGFPGQSEKKDQSDCIQDNFSNSTTGINCLATAWLHGSHTLSSLTIFAFAAPLFNFPNLPLVFLSSYRNCP